jgi:Flp pilus assembly protein TadG
MRPQAPANDRGAAAVELALILPFLILLVFGIIDFGRAYNAKLTLTHAAREGVRVWALGGSLEDATARVTDAATGISDITVTTTDCTFGGETSLTVSAGFEYLTPLIADLAPATSTLSATGVMRCGG